MDEPEGSVARGYVHAGADLVPSVIEELTLELFTGKTVWRNDIQIVVVSEHQARGGRPGKTGPTSQTKKALASLKKKGLASNNTYGQWKILGPSGGNSSPEYPAVEPPAAVGPVADREIGEGAESVYVYYLPHDRKIAEMAHTSRWSCKIGRTAGAATDRIRGQAGTALSETPSIGLVIRTENARAVERAIHAVLDLKGRHPTDGPGKEWFYTSPGEIEAIWETLTKSWN